MSPFVLLTASGSPLIAYGYISTLVRPVNGSSETGYCEDPWQLLGIVSCDHPETSVLFDGNIPTLTGLHGDSWADQLLTLNTALLEEKDTLIQLSLPNIKRLRLEVALFNCPEWGIATSRITIQTSQLFHQDYSRSKDIDPTLTSCDSLVRVCMPIDTKHTLGNLRFDPPPGSNWTHLAEVTFYTDTSTCPPDTVLNHHPTPSLPPSTTAVTTDTTQGATNHTPPGGISHTPTEDTGHTHPDITPSGDVNHTSTGDTIHTFPGSTDHTPIPTPCPCEAAQCEEACPSPSSLATILGSSIPLTILAIMTTVLFSMVALCKYRSKFKVRYDMLEEGEGQDEERDREEEEEEEEEGEEEEEEEEHIYEEVSECGCMVSIHCPPGIDPFSNKWTFCYGS